MLVEWCIVFIVCGGQPQNVNGYVKLIKAKLKICAGRGTVLVGNYLKALS